MLTFLITCCDRASEPWFFWLLLSILKSTHPNFHLDEPHILDSDSGGPGTHALSPGDTAGRGQVELLQGGGAWWLWAAPFSLVLVCSQLRH